jgi:hypothetical protein
MPASDRDWARRTRGLPERPPVDPRTATGSAPYRSVGVARRFGARDQRGVSVHRESLIQKGLIWSPRRGQLDFTVPLFAEYLTENHPLETFDESA